VMTDMNINERTYSFVAHIRNQASVCANAKESPNPVPSARVKLTTGLAILDAACLRLDRRSEIYLLGLY
jgi:hypothetical protein